MRIYAGRIKRPIYNKKQTKKEKEKELNEEMEKLDIKGGSAPIMLGEKNNYLVSSRGGGIIRNHKAGTKKKPINLLL
jgi:hypothetical protein